MDKKDEYLNDLTSFLGEKIVRKKNPWLEIDPTRVKKDREFVYGQISTKSNLTRDQRAELRAKKKIEEIKMVVNISEKSIQYNINVLRKGVQDLVDKTVNSNNFTTRSKGIINDESFIKIFESVYHGNAVSLEDMIKIIKKVMNNHKRRKKEN